MAWTAGSGCGRLGDRDRGGGRDGTVRGIRASGRLPAIEPSSAGHALDLIGLRKEDTDPEGKLATGAVESTKLLTLQVGHVRSSGSFFEGRVIGARSSVRRRKKRRTKWRPPAAT